VFGSLERASGFFRADPLGYSRTSVPCQYDGIELNATRWAMSPLDVHHVESSFFDDTRSFPRGSVEFDSALLMHPTPAVWTAHPRFDASAPGATYSSIVG
jgi:hypothetical protein